MPVTDVQVRLIEDYVNAMIANELARHGVSMTVAARELFAQTIVRQVDEGIVTADQVVDAIMVAGTVGIADFYLMKFGPVPLTYNRAVRLLADMHDKWLAVRRRSLAR